MKPGTPITRGFYITFLLGGALLVIAIVGFGVDWGFSRHQWFDQLQGIFFDRYHSKRWYGWCAWAGLILFVIGYVGAYHFDRTLGRLMGWVRTGQ